MIRRQPLSHFLLVTLPHFMGARMFGLPWQQLAATSFASREKAMVLLAPVEWETRLFLHFLARG